MDFPEKKSVLLPFPIAGYIDFRENAMYELASSVFVSGEKHAPREVGQGQRRSSSGSRLV